MQHLYVIVVRNLISPFFTLHTDVYKRHIKEGELEYFDPLNEEIKINLMVDKWDEREEAPTMGYYASFELTNGFRKAIYWSKRQMMAHADKYSAAFSKEATQINTKYGAKEKVSFEDYEAGNYDQKDSWMYSSHWYKDFDQMAYKTMLRQLISKWGIMSIDLQNAMAVSYTHLRFNFRSSKALCNFASSAGASSENIIACTSNLKGTEASPSSSTRS